MNILYQTTGNPKWTYERARAQVDRQVSAQVHKCSVRRWARKGSMDFLGGVPTGSSTCSFSSMVRSGGAWRRDVTWRPPCHGLLVHAWRDVTWRDVTWRDVTWRDVTWRDVTWRDVTWRDVTWRDVTWRDVTWRDVTWRDVTWRDATASLPTTAPDALTSWRDVTASLSTAAPVMS